jgi:hypothetical protein
VRGLSSNLSLERSVPFAAGRARCASDMMHNRHGIVRPQMKFCVTSVANDETASLLRDQTADLDALLNSVLGEWQFGDGIDQLTLVIVSVDDDPQENTRWAVPHNKLGAFTHHISGQRVRFLSLSALVPPNELLRSTSAASSALIRHAVLGKLSARPERLPSGYNFQDLAAAVASILAATTDGTGPGAVA